MREYETIYLIKPDLPADVAKGLQEKISDIIKKQSGHVLSKADWGKRRLAYQIQKFRHAQYLYIQYLDPGHSLAEIERILKYDDRVIRFLSVKLKDKVNAQERLAKPVEAPLPPEEFHSHEEEFRGSRGYDRGRSAPPGESDMGEAVEGLER